MRENILVLEGPLRSWQVMICVCQILIAKSIRDVTWFAVLHFAEWWCQLNWWNLSLFIVLNTIRVYVLYHKFIPPNISLMVFKAYLFCIWDSGSIMWLFSVCLIRLVLPWYICNRNSLKYGSATSQREREREIERGYDLGISCVCNSCSVGC